jgi:hypothetical protein
MTKVWSKLLTETFFLKDFRWGQVCCRQSTRVAACACDRRHGLFYTRESAPGWADELGLDALLLKTGRRGARPNGARQLDIPYGATLIERTFFSDECRSFSAKDPDLISGGSLPISCATSPATPPSSILTS